MCLGGGGSLNGRNDFRFFHPTIHPSIPSQTATTTKESTTQLVHFVSEWFRNLRIKSISSPRKGEKKKTSYFPPSSSLSSDRFRKSTVLPSRSLVLSVSLFLFFLHHQDGRMDGWTRSDHTPVDAVRTIIIRPKHSSAITQKI